MQKVVAKELEESCKLPSMLAAHESVCTLAKDDIPTIRFQPPQKPRTPPLT